MLVKVLIVPLALIFLLQVYAASADGPTLTGMATVVFGVVLLVRYLLGDKWAVGVGIFVLVVVVLGLGLGGSAVSARNNVATPFVLLAGALVMAWPRGWSIALALAVGLVAIGLLSLDGGATLGSRGGGTDTGFVALGDSYSAGEGAAAYDPETATHSNRCHRSERAWARLLGAPAANHFACSGAKSDDYYAHQQGRLRALTGVHTVTLTFGGNNMGFPWIILRCRSLGCPHWDDRQAAKVQKTLTKLYQDIKRDAPGAKIYVVGYPDIVPKPGTHPVKCGWLQPYDRNLGRLDEIEAGLDTMLRDAVTNANDPDIVYVSVRDAMRGHELCTKDSWMYPITPLKGPSPWNKQQGHPRGCGQIALARAVSSSVAPSGTLPELCRPASA